MISDSEFKVLISNIDEVSYKSLSNAANLIQEAQTLFDARSLERAYFLALTALEEFNKSVLLSDYQSNLINKSQLKSLFEDHAYKLNYAARKFDGVKLHLEKSNNLKNDRENSLYVGINNNQISLPSDLVTEDYVKDLIHFVWEEIDSLFTAEWMNERRGTKALLK